MCDPISAIGGLIGGSIFHGAKAAKAQKKAQKANEASAAAEAQRSEQQFNKSNQKTPDIAQMFARAQDAARTGQGATFLTGPGGVAPGSLMLGRATPLGG